MTTRCSVADVGVFTFSTHPQLRAAIEAEHTTTSEIIREAIRRFLQVA